MLSGACYIKRVMLSAAVCLGVAFANLLCLGSFISLISDYFLMATVWVGNFNILF